MNRFIQVFSCVILLLMTGGSLLITPQSVQGVISAQQAISDFSLDKALTLPLDAEVEAADAPPIDFFYGEEASSLYDRFSTSSTQRGETRSSSSDNLVVNVDTDRATYSPDQQVHGIVQVTDNFVPQAGINVNVTIFAGEMWWYYCPFYDRLPYKEPDVVYETIITTNIDGEALFSFQPDSEGFFTIYASLPNVKDYYYWYGASIKTIQVAKVAALWRVPYTWSEGDSVLSYAAIFNTTDFTPISGATANMTLSTGWDEEQTTTNLYYGESNADGLAIAQFNVPEVEQGDYWSPYSWGYVILEITYEDSVLTTYQWLTIKTSGSNTEDYYYWYDPYDWDGLYDFVITTDKPIYQPGQDVLVRLLLWESSFLNASREVAANVPVELELTDPQGFKIFHDVKNTDQLGVLSFFIPLDEDAELGDYGLSFTVNGVTEVRVIPVDKYQRPAFEIEINAPDYVAPGKTLKGDFVATYYFGKPVTDGTFEAKIYIDKTLKTSKTGTLDADGKASLPALKIPDDSYGYACEINITVTDPADRSVTSSKVISLRPDLYIWGYVQDYRPAIGDPIDLTVNVYAFDSNSYWWWRVDPVDAKVKAEVYSTGDDYWSLDKLITTVEFDVEGGSGSYSIPIDPTVAAWYKEFRIKLKATTSDGRTGESYWHPWVKYNAIDLDLEIPDVINPNNGIEVSISLRNALTTDPEIGKVRLTVYDSEYDYLGKAIITVDGTEMISIPLTAYASTGYYWATAVLCNADGDPDWDIGYEYIHFTVGSSGKLEIHAEDSYKVGETASITFELSGATASGPIYYEIAKRGIITVQTLSGTNTITLPIGIELSPQITIYAFAIDSSGHLYMDQCTIEITFGIEVLISSNKDVYEPGETATFDIELTDHLGNPLSGSASLALIDSSVYGVKEDDEPENEVFTEDDVWSFVVGRITWFSLNSWYGPYLYYDDYYYGYPIMWAEGAMYEYAQADVDVPPTAIAGNEREQAAERDVKVRRNLPETALWLPAVGITGSTSIEVILPDNIGEWTLRAVVTCGGKGVLVKYTVKTFLDFFLQSKNPLFVTQDDTFKISAILFNYGTNTETNLSISMTNVQILNNPEQRIMSISNGLTMVTWTVYALSPGMAEITFIAYSDDGRSDGFVAYTEIKPNAVQFLTEKSGLIDMTQIPFEIYPDALAVSAKLTIIPGLEGATLEGWERLVGYPYGCIEQTMSQLLPTVTVYQYLKETDQLTSEDDERLSSMIITGIARVYSMVQPNGGWGWWWKDETNVFMTAYVLYGLGLVSSAGFEVDSSLMNKAISLLFKKQDSDGSWSPGYYTWRIATTELTAFTLRALLTADSSLTSHTKVDNALNYLESSWAGNPNAYFAGLVLSSIGGTSLRSNFQTTLLTWLTENHNTDSTGIHWGDASYWYALGGSIEVTAVAIQGILKTSGVNHLLKVMQAVEWLMSRQARWGWGNTADTAAAVMALTAVADFVSDDVDATIDILLDDSTVDSFHVTTHEAAKRISLPTDVGSHTLSISKSGTGYVFYHFELEQYVRNDPAINFSTAHGSSPEKHSYEVTVHLEVDTNAPAIPINVAISPYSYGTLELVSDPVVTIDLIENSATATFTFESTTEASVIGGFLISYSFAARTDLTNQAPGIVSRIYGPVDLDSTQRRAFSLSSSSHRVPSIPSKEESDITLTRTYSKKTDIEIGEMIEVTLKVTNNLDTPFNYLIVTDPILAGYSVETDSLLQDSARIAHARLKSDHVAFFIPRLDKTTAVTIKYLITALTSGSISAISATVSPMYQNEIYYSEAERLETKGIVAAEFSTTGAIYIDEIAPTIVLGEVMPFSPTNADPITINATVQDSESGVQSVTLFYQDSEAETWNTEAMLPEESISDQYSATIYTKAGTLRYFIQATDALGNVKTTEIYTLKIDSASDDSLLPALILLIFGAGAVVGFGTLGYVFVRKKYL